MDSPEPMSSLVCANCGSASVSLRHVRSAFWQDDRLVVVQNIPALVCGSCAEQSYDDTTVIKLDLLRSKGFPVEQAQAELRVPVFAFDAPVAAKSLP